MAKTKSELLVEAQALNLEVSENNTVAEITAAIKAAAEKVADDTVEAVKETDGVMLITADHGNAEQMLDYKTGEPHTAHTTNPVPLILVGKEDVKLKEGKLADLAPTMLQLMNLPKPEEMTGESIIVE